MCPTVSGNCWSICIGVPIVPLPTTRTEWSSYPRGVEGGALDAGDVDVDMEDSGVSGVSGVLGACACACNDDDDACELEDADADA